MMIVWRWIVGSRLGRLAASVLAAIAIVFGLILYGKKLQKQQEMVEDLEDYKKIRERIDETPISVDLDDALDRLSKNDQLRD